MKIRAAVLNEMGAPAPYAQSKPLKIETIELDPPGPGEILVKIAAAAGIAAINTLAHLGTGAITSVIGVLRDKTGSFPVALLPLCVLTGVGCLLVFWIGREQARAAPAAVPAPAH